MSFTVVIPSRYGSTRLEGKPLLDIGGKPMVQHVYERACESRANEVVIATDDPRIADACSSFGARALMTSPEHPSGTDRIEEVARQLQLPEDAIVVNVQGDEPLIPAAVIDQVAGNLALMIGAQDGIYIAGGIAKRYPDLLKSSSFRSGFENKGRHRSLMEPIPTSLITHSQPGLLGASYAARQMDRQAGRRMVKQ